jgi:hypothetical protein
MPPKAKAVSLTRANLAAKDAADQAADSASNAGTSAASRKRSIGGYYVEKRTQNPVQQDIEKDKAAIVDLLNGDHEKQTRMLLVMIQSGEVEKWYQKKHGRGQKSEEAKQQWNPNGRWSKIRDLRNEWMAEQICKFDDNASEWLARCKQHDRYCVPKIFSYMTRTSRFQQLPEGFHLQGSCEQWVTRLQEINKFVIEQLMNGTKDSGEIPWTDLGVCSIVFEKGNDGQDHPFLTRRWPDPSVKVQLDLRYAGVSTDDWFFVDNHDLMLCRIKTKDAFVNKPIIEFDAWANTLKDLEKDTNKLFAEERRKYLIQADSQSADATPLKTRRMSVTPPSAAPSPLQRTSSPPSGVPAGASRP